MYRHSFILVALIFSLSHSILAQNTPTTNSAAKQDSIAQITNKTDRNPKRGIKEILKSNQRFENIIKEADAYFKNKYPDKTPLQLTEGEHRDGSFVKYQRWKAYWEGYLTESGHIGYTYQFAEANTKSQTKNSGEYTNANWENINYSASPDSVYIGMGRTTSIGFHPTNPSIFYVGAAYGGIWRTTDGGQTYTPLGDDLPFLAISSIIVNKDDPNTIYIAISDHVWYGAPSIGVYKSTNGGTTWAATNFTMNPVENKRIYWMEADPNNANKMLIATEQGLYKTEDGFNTVTLVNSEPTTDVRFKPNNSNIVFQVTQAGAYLMSTDGGNNFSPKATIVGEGNVTRLIVSAQNPDKVFFTRGNVLSKSIDGGNSFIGGQLMPEKVTTGMFDPLDDNVFVTGNVKVHRSDNGQAFTTLTIRYKGENSYLPLVHADQRNMFVNPINPNLIYICNDGGLYSYNPSANQFNDLSAGLVITQFYDIAVSQSNAAVVSGGTQDNGNMYRNSDGSWNKFALTGDGMTQDIDPDNPNYRYWTYQLGSMYRWHNGTNTSIRPVEQGAWETPYKLDPNNSSRIIAGYDKIYASDNRGDSWVALSDVLWPNLLITEIAIAPSNSDRIYATNYWNKLYVGDVNTNSWVEKSTPLGFVARIKDIEVDPYDMNTIYVVSTGFFAGSKVYKSTDGGNNWTNISDNLPNVPVFSIETYRDAPNGLFVGTETGVFYRDDNVSEWQEYGSLPHTRVSDIEIQYTTNQVFIGTHGRGIYVASAPNVLDCPDVYNLTFENHCSESAKLYWNNGNELIFYKDVPSCGLVTQSSFDGHNWVLQVNGTTVANYTANCNNDVFVLENCSGTSLTNIVCEAKVNDNNWTVLAACAINVCEGNKVQLSVKPNGAASYYWTGPNGFSGTGDANGNILISDNISLNAAGDYTVVVTNSAGCTASRMLSVTIDEKPTLTEQISVNGGLFQATNQVTVCPGDDIILDLLGSFDSNWSFSYTRPDDQTLPGGINGVDKDQIAFNATGGTWLVEYTNPKGCVGDGSFIIDNDLILECEHRINGIGSWTLGNCYPRVCEGNKLELSVNPNGAVSYDWTGPNGFSGAGDAYGNILISNNISLSDAGDYTVVITNSEGCTATETISVGVNEKPVATATTTNATCDANNGSITFTFPDNPYRVSLWFSLDGGVTYEAEVSDNIGSVTYNDLASGDYHLFARWGNSDCPTDLSTVTIDADEAPFATATTTNTTCGANNGSMTFTFPDHPIRTGLEFSLNGGSTYPFAVDDNQGTFVIQGLSSFTYDLFVRWGNGECATDLSNVTINSDGGDVASPGTFNPGFVSSCTTNTFNPPLITPSAASCTDGSTPTYQWQSQAISGGQWMNVNNATDASYNPSSIGIGSTSYRRLASCPCQVNVPTTNSFDVHVYNPKPGSIAGNETQCGDYVPTAIVNTTAPSDGRGNITYRWQRKVNNGNWTTINGATADSYNPPVITITNQYRRQARFETPCTDWVTSNIITKEVTSQAPGTACNDGNSNTTNDVIQADGCTCEGTPVTVCDNVNFGGKIGFGGSCSESIVFCNASDDSAPAIGNCDSPTGGSGDLEIIWLKNEVDCSTPTITIADLLANPSISNWEIISGATELSYNPNQINTSTCYLRYTRRAGCTQYLGESNSVQITVDPNCGNNNEPDCANIDISTGNGSIAVSGLDGAPVTSLQVFNAQYQQEFSCFADCNTMETVAVTAGTYYVYVKYYTANYILICQEAQTVTVTDAGGNDPCANQGGDADNDGVCAAVDCDDNDPSVPATVGSSCDDDNPNTIDDEIQNDGCTCAGTLDTGNNDPDCANISITTGSETIAVSGLDGAPVTSLQVFNAQYQQEFSCFADCNTMETVTVTAGTYYVYVKYYTANYILICQEAQTVTVTDAGGNDPCANQGGDADNDGVCAAVDCDDNDPSVPATVGSSCDDGNPNTIDDEIQNDGCTCAGTLDTGNNDPDCANISITTGSETIAVSGLDGAPVTSLQVFNAQYQQEFSCFADCNTMETVAVTAGTYYVYVKYYTAGYQLICQVYEVVTVTENGGGGSSCDNFVTGGEIGFLSNCSSSINYCPGNGGLGQIMNCEFPSGGSGAIEYVWLKSTVTSAPPSTITDPNWTLIAGANQSQYQPNNVTETTYFIRCARRAGCMNYTGKSNVSVISVDANCNGGGSGTTDPNCADVTVSASNGEIIVTGLDGAPVTSVQIFTSSWANHFSCFADCEAPIQSVAVSDDTYYVYVKYYTAAYNLICTVEETVNVVNGMALLALTHDFDFQVTQWEEHSEIMWSHNGGNLVESYVIERSADGENFEAIAAKFSKGTTATELYQDYDVAPLVADNYYRIKMVNLDGSIGYSVIQEVRFENLIDFTLFPNPAHQFVKLNLESVMGREVDIHIYNSLGQRMNVIHLEKVYNKYYQVDVQDLEKGHYTVWMSIAGHQAVSKKLIIGN